MESRAVKKREKAGPSKRTKNLPDGLNPDDEKRFDEFLDDTAEKYNVSRRLGKQIVKNIIASEESGKLLKVAIGLADPSELPEQKLTRSKSKVTVPLKPVDIPKLGGRAPNFLYVTDFGNEEEDTDFVVDELEEVESSSSGESSEEEMEEEEDEREIEQELEELAKSPELAFDRGTDIWVNPLSKDVNLNSVAVDHLADTNRELYIQLLERDWNEADEDYFEANDPDYNYEEEEKEEEPDIYEGFTHKLAVPRRECQLLLEEAYYDKVDINEEKKRIKEEGSRRPRRNQKAVKTAVMPSDGSCSLLKPGPYTFKPEELEQLTMQLEQHVQHLIQTFVLCSHDETKRNSVDISLAMFNELNGYDIDAQQQGKKSLFNISNLCTGINTIHDILNIPRVPDSMVQWQNAPAPAEACLALMRSEALLYPELVPLVQPHNIKRLDSRWSPAEETLLLLGLIQFGYIRNSTQTFSDGRYYQIHKNLLPAKTPAQICNHMSAFRKSPRPTRIQQLILKAEDENPMITFEFVRQEKFPMTMDRWPEDKRPCWYEAFQKKFYCMGNSIYSKDSLSGNTVILPNTVTLMVKGPDGSLQPLQDGIIVINAPTQNGEMSTVQLQMAPTAVTVASTSSAPVPPDPIPTPPAASITVTGSSGSCEEDSQAAQETESIPEPEEFVDIEAVSSPEEETITEPTVIPEALAPTVIQPEIAVEMKENEPGPSQSEIKAVPTVNKRKLRTPVKITVPVKKKKPVRKTEERRLGEKRMVIDQLREDLAMSDDSESVISPQKLAYLQKKRAYLDSIQPGTSSAVPPPSKVEQFQFQDMSRDMPILQPLEIVLPEEKRKKKLENYIPMTPRCRTPSEGSLSLDEMEEIEDSPKEFSEYSVPNTPRDDNYTHSPTLLKMDPAVAQAFLERVEVHGAGKRNLFPTDFSHLHRPQESYIPYSLPCSSWDSGSLGEIRHRRPPTIITLTEEPGKKWRKRTRQEKMNDGLEGMMDPLYRQKQEQLLCKHIHSDIKKRLTLRRDLYSKVKEVFQKCENYPRMILKETYNLLQAGYPEVFGLIACLFPEEALPEVAEADRYRKSYRESLDMLMAIDAYTQRAKYKNNKNSKSLFRLMMSFCTEEISPAQFGEKMRDLFSDAPPLWNIIKTKLPVMYEDRVQPDQVEFVDLSLPNSSLSPNRDPPQIAVDKFQEATSSNAEVVDLCQARGPHPPKQRNKLHVHNGHLYVNDGANFTMVETKRRDDILTRPQNQGKLAESVKKPEKPTDLEKIENPVKRKSTPKKKPPLSTWTKELDMKIITAYNSIDEENDEAVIDSLVAFLPFPRDQISQRLKFLLSLLISK